MKLASLAEATQALRAFMPSQQATIKWDFALDQMKQMMTELGSPQERVKVIHVAGTSGKTSTCYYIADMLHQAGKTVGLTVSPHVDSVNERVQINGQPISEQEFCDLLAQFLELPAVVNNQPSYFGVMVAFAYWVFAQKQVDYAVVEVGLGGRLDGTNVVERADKVSVITDIGLDHTGMLGNTLTAIAAEKAGIIQDGNQVIMAEQGKDITDVIRQRVALQNAQLKILQPTGAPTRLPLFQQRNWAVAQAVVRLVGERDNFQINDEQFQASAGILIPARMEVIEQAGKTIILDGAHNVQKITALCQSIQEKYPDQKLATLVSFVNNKDESMTQKLASLKTVTDNLIITTFKTEQDEPKWSVEPAEIKRAAQRVGFSSVAIKDIPRDAFQALLECPEQIILVTGSFYLLNHIRPLVRENFND